MWKVQSWLRWLWKPELFSAPRCCPNICGIIKGDAWARGSTPPCSTSQQSQANADGCSTRPADSGLSPYRELPCYLSAPLSALYPPPSSFSYPLLSPHTSPSSLIPTLSILQYVRHNLLAPSLSLGTDHLPSPMPKLGCFHEIQH